ncbi:MAG: DUF1570 domain-containing protein [Planctomycetes bacterium]|nr:DUF1570 domain-containing protein [Planctomycetota bacterium]MCB9904583.1 DUF1570 domain-containing protein [Planctomycetota bacterium]
MRTRSSRRLLTTALLLIPCLALGAPPNATRGDEAPAVADAPDADVAISRAALLDHLQRFPDDPAGHRSLGQLLLSLGERDAAAHHLERAQVLLQLGGDDKAAKSLEKDLNKADQFNRRRHTLLRDLTKTILLNAEQLAAKDNVERALAKLEGLVPIAEGDKAEEVRELYERLRKRFEELDIEEGLESVASSEPLPLVTYESEHYVIEANLEPELARRVGELMDSVHGHYVEVYFDGDDAAARADRATIRIHPDWDAMSSEWTGGRAPQGWWSPGQHRVVCYDSRSNGEGSTLDWMLETLFHEASHQFMTLRSRKGGWSPSWLNEGTASFFEGTVAMADNSVLWPDAAQMRLQNLAHMIRSHSGPGVEKVISHAGPGSYPADHYAYGWGLVYFFQQFEDPTTLEFVYRPLYTECLDEITSKGGESREMFEKYFVGARSPLGHEDLAAFVDQWERWILNEVQPLYLGSPTSIRELRVAKIDRYLASATAAAKDKKAPVSESELLERALAHIEYVRTRLDGTSEPDAALWLQQIDVLEQLGKPKSAAPLLQELLELAEDGVVELDPELAGDLEKRLQKLDRGNWALLNAKSREGRLRRNARNLLEDYETSDPPFLLRGYTFARAVGLALGDDDVLLPHAEDLRERARAAGLLLGTIRALNVPGDDWDTIYTGNAERFEHTGSSLLIESVRPMAFVNTSFEVGHEYELRCRLERRGELYLSTNHGLVISATPDGDWAILDFGAKGNAYLRRLELSGGGAQRRLLETFEFDPPLADDEHPLIELHVVGRQVSVKVGDREPLRFTLPDEIPPAKHIGFSAKDATTVLKDAEVKIYP